MKILPFLIMSIPLSLIATMASATDTPCLPPCVPFTVKTDSGEGTIDFQAEYYDCKTKQKTYGYVKQVATGSYCAAPNTEVRVEEWAGIAGTTKSWNIWPPTSVGNGWTVTCKDNGGHPSCNGVPAKADTCKIMSVENLLTYSDAIAQPEYTECLSKNYIKAKLERTTKTFYFVEPGTNVRVEESRGEHASVNRWGPQPIGNGWTVTCAEVKGDMNCTAVAK